MISIRNISFFPNELEKIRKTFRKISTLPLVMKQSVQNLPQSSTEKKNQEYEIEEDRVKLHR